MSKIKRLFTKNLKLKVIAVLITMHIFFVKKAADENIREKNTLEKGVEE